MTYAPSPADALVERRRLRRRLAGWRAGAVIAAVLGVIGVGLALAPRGGFAAAAPHVARVEVGGLITGSREQLRLLDRVGRSNAAAVVLSIDSPGGTTAGSEALYEAIRGLAAKKPTVAVVGSVAASGAYIAALGTDRIVARGNALVGSIGVLAQVPNVTKLLGTIGVEVETVRSSPLKALPNGLEPTPPAAREAVAATVRDSFEWFRGLVRERRALTEAELNAVADGRVFTARQGLPLKLVDQIGGERDAVAWLERERGVAKDLPVRDWRPAARSRWSLPGALGALAAALGAPALGEALGALAGEGEALAAPGLLSVWRAGAD